MKVAKAQHRVLVVSDSDNVCTFIKELLPHAQYSLVWAKNAGEAKRACVSVQFDLVIINSPLKDDFGIQLATDLSEGSTGVLLFVKSDVAEQVAYKVEELGVFVLPKPTSRQAFCSAVRLLGAFSLRLRKMEEKTKSLRDKMADIRAVNRAKWLLIEKHNMNETDAHYYIEKQAMDLRLPRREVAENIIRTYET